MLSCLITTNPQAKSFLGIGLGTGTTLYAAAFRDYETIDCVEINKAVLEASKKFFYPALFRDERIKFIPQDARNYLFLNQKKYDIISSEPSYPTESEVSHLFTKEFFQLVKSRLSPGGIFVQWLPYYILSQENVDMMVKTLGTVFPEIYVWQVMESADLLLVAGEHLATVSETDIQQKIMDFIHRSAYPWLINISLWQTPEGVERIVSQKSLPVNSDNHPYLEFIAIRNKIVESAQKVR